MKITGIIAEYNPFHNGHAYQLGQLKKSFGADYIVVAMSGDFVQRGAPALIDKYARTKMALCCGADLVVELPALWATASAECFARAGVALFEKMGCVDSLCFGAETGDLALLSGLAEFFFAEPVVWRDALVSYLRSGVSFPRARVLSLAETLAKPADSDERGLLSENARRRLSDVDVAMLRCALDTPNNILAIEYLKALRHFASSMQPVLIQRVGAGYHTSSAADADDFPGDAGRMSKQQPDDAAVPASASGIRDVLLSEPAGDLSENTRAFLASAMPEAALTLLLSYLKDNPPLTADDFSDILGYRLLTLSASELAAIGDCGIDIANRLRKYRHTFSSFSALAAAAKSRNITRARMDRILLHTILSITDDDYRRASAAGYVPYLRILGFRRAAAPVLSQIKKHAAIPLISKLADANALLARDARALLEKDIFASELYAQCLRMRTDPKKRTTPCSEYTREIVLV